MRTDFSARWRELLGLGHEPLDDFARASVREIKRRWRQSNGLPAALVEAVTHASHAEVGA